MPLSLDRSAQVLQVAPPLVQRHPQGILPRFEELPANLRGKKITGTATEDPVAVVIEVDIDGNLAVRLQGRQRQGDPL